MASTTQRTKMQIFKAMVGATAFITSLLGPLPAIAQPQIYLSTFSYSGTAGQCVKSAEAVLRAHDFSNIKQSKKEKSRFASVWGYHKDEMITAEIQCAQKLGVTTLGVGGVDGDITYKIFSKLYDANW